MSDKGHQKLSNSRQNQINTLFYYPHDNVWETENSSHVRK